MLQLKNSEKILLVLVVIVFFRQWATAQPISAPLFNPVTVDFENRLENQKGKTVLVFTPHPDDETFAMGGTLALLAANGNDIHVVVYTNDNKGSLDLEMTSERLARIRRAEEEKSCEILGIKVENIHWLGYDDGDLEYADAKVLRGKIARLLKLYRPDIVFTADPGQKWNQWHKTDHRMAANITQDAFIAAEWHLYYPQHLLDEDLQPFHVKDVYYYYSQEPNYEVDITSTFDLKIRASTAHVSQFEPSTSKYSPTMPEEVFNEIKKRFVERNTGKDNRIVERFRMRK